MDESTEAQRGHASVYFNATIMLEFYSIELVY